MTMPTVTAPPGLARFLAHNPGAIVEEVARDHGVSPHDIVAALPSGMRRFAPAGAFVDAMTEIARWGDVTLIVHTDDGKRCIGLAFVERPFSHARRSDLSGARA